MLQCYCIMQRYFVCIADVTIQKYDPLQPCGYVSLTSIYFFLLYMALNLLPRKIRSRFFLITYFFAFEMKQLYFDSNATHPQMMHSISLSPVGWNKGKVR